MNDNIQILDIDQSDVDKLEDKLLGPGGELEYLKDLKGIVGYCESED